MFCFLGATWENCAVPNKHYEPELTVTREEEGQAEPGAAVWRQYYYAAGQRVAVRDGQGSGTTGLSFLLGDHLGSTHVTTDASGTKLAELRYKPWGDVRYAEGSTPTSFRFTGQREEADLGFYYYGARWYDPALGHFLQADNWVPDLGDPTAYNRYAYTLFNPVKYTDPTGRKAEQGTGGGIGGLGLSEPEERKILETYATIQSIFPGSAVKFIEPISTNKPTLTEKMLQGDINALTELVVPSHGGLRVQVEFSGEVLVGVSGSVGANLVYNRNSDELVGNIDWAFEPGVGIGGGASATGGVLIGWGSGDVSDVVEGYSWIIGGTAAAGLAASMSMLAPMDENGIPIIDSYSGQIPPTIYLGLGGGNAYAGLGGGINGSTGIIIDLTPHLPWK